MWRTWVMIAITAWLLIGVLTKRFYIPYKHPIFISLAAFFGIVLVANTLGNSPYHSFWSNAERMDGFIGLLHLGAYLVALVGLMRNKVNMKRYLLFLFGIAIALAFLGLRQDKDRIDSVLGNPIYLGSLAYFGFFIAVYLFSRPLDEIKNKNKALRKRIGYGVLALLFLLTIWQTGTRGALLGVAGGGIATAIAILWKSKKVDEKWWRRIAAVVLISTTLLITLFVGWRAQLAELPFIQNNYMLSRVADISFEKDQSNHRLVNWEMAIEGVKERPLLGWGQESYSEVFSKHYNLKGLYNAEQWFDRTHNVLLDWLVFAGILGFIAYLAIFITAIGTLWKKSNLSVIQKSTLTGLIIGYIFQNLVAFDSLVSGIYLYAIFGLIILETSKEEQGPAKAEFRAGPLVISGLVIALSAGWLYYSIYLPRQANNDLITVFATAQQNKNKDIGADLLPVMESAFENKTFLSREILHQIYKRQGIFKHTETSTETVTGFVSLVMSESNRTLTQENYPTKTLVSYGGFFINVGALDQAEQTLLLAHQKSPTKANINWLLGHVYEKQDRLEEAYEKVKYVADEVPQYKQAQKIKNDFETTHPEYK